MNELEEPLDDLFKKIANLQGTLLHIENALTSYSKIFKQRYEESKVKFKDRVPDFALGSSLIISDLTGETDNGWNYYYPTKRKHIVAASKYDHEIYYLIRRETGYSLAQGFEAFSTFLKDILATYFAEKSSEAIKLKVIDEIDWSTDINWKNKMRNNTGKNNKNLFKLIRRISNDFEYSEQNNNKEIDLQAWYSAYSLFRHKMTHSSGKLLKNDKEFKHFNPKEREYLKRYFPYRETDDVLIFEINRREGDLCLNILAEYAFLIFKELSIKLDRDWKILKYMKK